LLLLKGSRVLVRMRNDRIRGKRNNWFLIKHRDGYERKNDGDTILDQDTSVASGRTMDQIAAGRGRGPKPFMIGQPKARDPRALWHSNRHIKSSPLTCTAVRCSRAARQVMRATDNLKRRSSGGEGFLQIGAEI